MASDTKTECNAAYERQGGQFEAAIGMVVLYGVKPKKCQTRKDATAEVLRGLIREAFDTGFRCGEVLGTERRGS